MNELPSKIPNVLSMSGYEAPAEPLYANYADRSRGFNIIIDSEFACAQHLHEYSIHPVHMDFIANHTSQVRASADDLMAFDYWIEKKQ